MFKSATYNCHTLPGYISSLNSVYRNNQETMEWKNIYHYPARQGHRIKKNIHDQPSKSRSIKLYTGDEPWRCLELRAKVQAQALSYLHKWEGQMLNPGPIQSTQMFTTSLEWDHSQWQEKRLRKPEESHSPVSFSQWRSFITRTNAVKFK